jgi:hypothetical protein
MIPTFFWVMFQLGPAVAESRFPFIEYAIFNGDKHPGDQAPARDALGGSTIQKIASCWFHDMENHGKYRMIVNDSDFFCEQFDMSQSMISQLGTSKCSGRIVKPTLPT